MFVFLCECVGFNNLEGNEGVVSILQHDAGSYYILLLFFFKKSLVKTLIWGHVDKAWKHPLYCYDGEQHLLYEWNIRNTVYCLNINWPAFATT